MTPKSILIINVTRIGDTLLATPAIRAIAHAYPDATIDLMGHPKRIEVAAHLPFIRRIASITKKWAPFRGWFDVLLQRKTYDLTFVYGFDEPLVAYALRVANQVVAYRQADNALNQRLYKVVEPPAAQSMHAVNLVLTLPAALGIQPAGLRLAYVVTDEERTAAKARLAQDVPENVYPLIGLQIASFPTRAYRNWPVESFIELCQRIKIRWPAAHFLILGGSDEHVQTTQLKAAIGDAATLYAGTLSLRETGAIMSQLNLYIGVDTGPTHLMGTFDIPLVALYHSHCRIADMGPLEHPYSFCIDHPTPKNGHNESDPMADISVDRVFDSVSRALISQDRELKS